MIDGTQKIDRTVPIPLYYQLKEIILGEIKNGSYKTGDLIPTENEISEMYKLSRTTVRQTISELAQEGWVYRVKSKGTFVGQPKIPQSFIRKVESYNNTIRRLGMTPSTEVLALEVRKTNRLNHSVLEAMNLTEHDKVVYLARLRFADGTPIVSVSTYLPYSSCSHLLEHDFNKEQLYSVLSLNDATRIFRIDRVAEAVAASSADVQLLNVKKGSPIHLFTSVGYNAMGEPVEYTVSRYRGDMNKFEITVFPEDS